MNKSINRRKLLAGTVAISAAVCSSKTAPAKDNDDNKKLDKTADQLRRGNSPWPVWSDNDESGLVGVLNTGHWGRLSGDRVAKFEKVWAEKMQAKHCIATSSGTTALLTALGALNIGPGDEVIMPPYTFVATFNVITNSYALPVFVDSDIESFQIDPKKIGAAINSNTKLLLPVHIGGSPFDVDAMKAISTDKKIPFIEDACQAHLASWRGRPVGNHGLGGCFSFQASKNLNSGEGGAVLTNDDEFANLCYNFHTPGGPKPVPSQGRGANFRMTEFQGTMLLSQFERVEKQSQQREQNAKYLSEMLSKIPGISPAKLYDGVDRSAWHLYMFRYDKSKFGGVSKDVFLAELSKEKVAASGGYAQLNLAKHVVALATNPHYQKIYGADFMAKWGERNKCPINDQLCSEAIWLGQTALLVDRSEMERIASSIEKIQRKLSV
ncbi:MAG: aminotransferase class I/II-fold pyridoxal phosphate-dependent enzyme [Pirellulales bacterium]